MVVISILLLIGVFFLLKKFDPHVEDINGKDKAILKIAKGLVILLVVLLCITNFPVIRNDFAKQDSQLVKNVSKLAEIVEEAETAEKKYIALKLLKDGMDKEKVSKITELSIEDVNQLDSSKN